MPDNSSLPASQDQTSYQTLRAWYLARLRKKISHAEERSLTPTALIQADRKAVEQLILQNDQRRTGATDAKVRPLSMRRLRDLWFATAVVLPVIASILIFVLVQYSPMPSKDISFWLITLPSSCAAISAMIIWSNLSRWRRKIVALQTWAIGTSPDTSQFDVEDEDVLGIFAIQLAEAVERERAIADYALDVFCSLGKEGDFLAVSPSAETLLGYSPAELMALSFFTLNTDEPGTRKSSREKLEALSSSLPATSFESRFKCKDGSLKDLVWSAEWSESQNCIFMVAQDVTARAAVERLKQQFVQMVSHDLRAPLTALQITLSLLADGVYGELNERGRKRVRTSSSDADRLINLINQLLDFERLEAGRVELVIDTYDVDDLVHQSVEAVISLAEKQHLQVETDVCHKQIQADGNKIIQVLVNLLGNAIKFSPPHAVIKIIGTASGEFVELKVIDKGRGIPEEFKDKIFDRFQQVSRDDARVQGGTGLGLAISKAIIEAHGGSIGVESLEGEGSTFWLRIPCSSRCSQIQKEQKAQL